MFISNWKTTLPAFEDIRLSFFILEIFYYMRGDKTALERALNVLEDLKIYDESLHIIKMRGLQARIFELRKWSRNTI